jgi:YgiT-type zinc finger domain-containing protein
MSQILRNGLTILRQGGDKMDCVMCKGLMEAKTINHIVDKDGHITIVKNVPALVCKQCGENFIDNSVAIKLEELLNKYSNSNVEVLIVNYIEKVA